MGRTPKGTLIFDVETHSQDLIYTMKPEEFVRLIGYQWKGDDEVTLTTDLEEIREACRSARWIVGHNLHSFDLPAVFGIDSNEPLGFAMEKRVYDTWTHATQVNPAPYEYIDRFGKRALADKPDRMKKWFGLDEQAHQLGVAGKTHDLKELALEFGDPSLPKKLRINDGFGKIPLDDQRYQDYLVGDVLASERVAVELLKKGPLNAYHLREQEIESRKAIISFNGLRVNREAAQSRVDALAERRAVILTELQERYGLPTEGKSPWATNDGKAAILAALADHGITPESTRDWPRTPNGNLQLGGEVLKSLTEGTSAEELGTALAELKGQRSLAQLALDSCYPDGKVHPDITMLQASGRWSTTRPGLTVWTNNGPGAVEKSYYVPDSDDDVLMEFDLSNADARMVAALSGDQKYAERFEPGADGHLINAWAAWGKDVVGTNKENPTTAAYRQKAKPLGHGWSYRGQPKALARSAGLPLEDAETFHKGMNDAFRGVVAWQDSVTKYARRHGYVVNDWGRVMRVEKGREFTQAPALLGQSGTREIVCDALLRMPVHILRRVKAQVHDALLLSIPKRNWEQCRDYVLALMQTKFKPKDGGQEIEFPASAGPPGSNWFEAIH